MVPLTVVSEQLPEFPEVFIEYVYVVSESGGAVGVPWIVNTPAEKLLITPAGRPSMTSEEGEATLALVAPPPIS